MIRIRYVTAEDLSAITELLRPPLLELDQAQTFAQLIEDRLEHAIVSLQLDVTAPEKEFYALVMEDMATQKIIGLCTLNSSVGHDFTFYTYKVTHIKKFSHDLAIFKELELLFLSNDYENFSECYSFYVAPEYRGHRFGKLLALARMLFIANSPERFAPNIIVPLRGITDNETEPPFWRGLGEQFFNIPFNQAYSLNSMGKKQFIADLVPRHPIYTQLLPEYTRQAIGQSHVEESTRREILEAMGFAYKGHINILDGGPILEGATASLAPIKNSRVVQVESVSDTSGGELYLIATKTPFFGIQANVTVHSQDAISIPAEAAKALNIDVGAAVRIIPFDSTSTK